MGRRSWLVGLSASGDVGFLARHFAQSPGFPEPPTGRRWARAPRTAAARGPCVWGGVGPPATGSSAGLSSWTAELAPRRGAPRCLPWSLPVCAPAPAAPALLAVTAATRPSPETCLLLPGHIQPHRTGLILCERNLQEWDTGTPNRQAMLVQRRSWECWGVCYKKAWGRLRTGPSQGARPRGRRASGLPPLRRPLAARSPMFPQRRGDSPALRHTAAAPRLPPSQPSVAVQAAMVTWGHAARGSRPLSQPLSHSDAQAQPRLVRPRTKTHLSRRSALWKQGAGTRGACLRHP